MDTRKEIIIQQRKQGKTFDEIGDLLKVSRQRVYQILLKKLPTIKNCVSCGKALGVGDGRKYCLECTSTGKAPHPKHEGRDWVRELVRIRDKQTCQKCFRVWHQGMRKFDVHHLDSNQEGDKGRAYQENDIDQLVTFCHKCHLNLHSVKEKMKMGKK